MKRNRIALWALILSFVFVANASASEIQGQVTAQGMKSPGSIAIYLDAIPAKTFAAPAAHTVAPPTHRGRPQD